ncbi:MAG: alanine racemase [Clostridiales bacterium]|nr:alanine racemase [Clostridiales bacterium]
MTTSLAVDRHALLHNLLVLETLTKEKGVSMSVVTKGLAGHKGLAGLLVENGADSICEANVRNLKKFEDLPAEKWLIRSPLISEADDVVRFADVSLVSELSVLKRLSEAAAAARRPHKAVVMLELGELREGCMPDEVIPLCKACLSMPGITLHGIGTHLSSMSEIVPDENNMSELAKAADMIEQTLGIRLPVISGGSSSSVKMLAEGRLPARINHLRIGEAILLGNIVCYDVPFEGARCDVFTLNAEIIEVKEKPSVPWGSRAPGATPIEDDPAFCDKGIRKRALVAVGKQDVFSKYLVPLDKDIKILGDTSDCLIADVTDCKKPYKPGDTVSFRLRYNGLVSAMASDSVEKILA